MGKQSVELKFEKYPEYKDSGVEWLGEIPSFWEVRKIKYLFRIGRGRVIAQTELVEGGKYPVYSSQTQNDGILGFIDTYDFDCKQITWTTDGANAGTVFLREGKHNCTNVCGTLIPFNGKQNIEFISYALKVAAQFYKRPDTNGAKIMNGEMAEIFVTIAHKVEQTAIANFLDKKTALIDKAIDIKQKQIELLKERRQILIHNAVTRGLNPDVKMKDSGVEWIGEVPEHWEVKKGKFLFNEINVRSLTGEEELLSVSHMTGVTPRSEKNVNMFMSEDYTGSKLCQNGDLIYNIMWAWMGALGVSYQTGIVSPSYAVYRQKRSDIFNPSYLEELLGNTNYVAYYNKVSTGLHSSRLRFYSNMFLDMKIGFPPKKEQDAIVEYLNLINKAVKLVTELKSEEIEKLKEYKSTLINSAVTGKIKVV